MTIGTGHTEDNVTPIVRKDKGTKQMRRAAPRGPRKVMVEDAGPEFTGIQDKKKPVTHEDVWAFIKKHAGSHEHNVEIVLTDNVATDAARPLPFSDMERDGRRAKVLWNLVNGVGEAHDRRLSTFLKEALKEGASRNRMPDLIAALNGGYSSSSKYWGTPYIKLRVVRKDS